MCNEALRTHLHTMYTARNGAVLVNTTEVAAAAASTKNIYEHMFVINS